MFNTGSFFFGMDKNTEIAIQKIARDIHEMRKQMDFYMSYMRLVLTKEEMKNGEDKADT